MLGKGGLDLSKLASVETKMTPQPKSPFCFGYHSTRHCFEQLILLSSEAME